MGLSWNDIKKGAKAVTGYASGTITGGMYNTNGGGWAQGGNPITGFTGANKKGDIIKGLNVTDALFGKKPDDIKPDDIAKDIRNTQSKGIVNLNTVLDKNTGESVVRAGAENAKTSILTAAQDARREAQASIARAGMGATSLSMANNRSVAQQAGKDIASVEAQIPQQIREQELSDAKTRINVGGINQNGINFDTIEGARSGGVLGYAAQLAPMAGSIGQLMNGNAALKRENRLAGQ